MNKHEETIRVLRNEYRFALAQQRESVRGLLNGRLSRLIQTALDASRLEPPWTSAVQEKLEDALELIRKFKID